MDKKRVSSGFISNARFFKDTHCKGFLQLEANGLLKRTTGQKLNNLINMF